MVIHAKFGVPKWCLDAYGEDAEEALKPIYEGIARKLEHIADSDNVSVEIEPTDGYFTYDCTSISSSKEDSAGNEQAEEEEETVPLRNEGCFDAYEDEVGSAPAHARDERDCGTCLSWRRGEEYDGSLSNREKSLAELKLWGMLCLEEDEELHHKGGSSILTVPEKRFLREMLEERTDISEILSRLEDALSSD